MANFAIYSRATVWFDGTLLAQEASISVDKKSGLLPVYTTVNGFAGMTQGSPHCEVTIETAVPSADFEINPDPYMRLARVVEVTIEMASNHTVFKGFVTDATYHHSVNDASKLSIKLMTEFTDFEHL